MRTQGARSRACEKTCCMAYSSPKKSAMCLVSSDCAFKKPQVVGLTFERSHIKRIVTLVLGCLHDSFQADGLSVS